MPNWKKVVISGSSAKLANETFISGHITASGIVKAEHLFSTDDAQITDDLVVGGSIDLAGNIDVDGTANLDAVDIDGNVDIAGTTAMGDTVTVATDKKIQFRDTGVFINSNADGNLSLTSDTNITFVIGSSTQYILDDGSIYPNNTNDVDLGSASKKFKNLFLTGDITASGHTHIVGDITSSAIIKAEHLHSTDDAQIDDDLTVGGDINMDSNHINIDGNGAVIFDNSNNNNAYYIRNGGTNAATLQMGTGSPGSNIKFTLDGSGNAFFAGKVGVGATASDFHADADDLVVGGGSGNTGLTIHSGTTGYGSIFFADGTADDATEKRGQIRYLQGTERMDFHTDNVSTAALSLAASGDATFAGNVSASGHIHAAGDITSSATVLASAIISDDYKIGGHVINDIDVSSEASNANDHLMTALAIQNRIEDFGYTTNAGDVTLSGAQTFTGAKTFQTNTKLLFRDSAIYLQSSTDGQLDIVADTEIQIAATTIDINGAINASGEIIAASLDISGDVDVDGTLEADAITVNGTSLANVITSTTVDLASSATNATNASHVLITDNESTNEHNQITFIEGAAGGTANRGLEADGHLTYNPSKGLVIAPNFSASGHIHAAGDITSSAIIKAEHFHSTDDAEITDDLVVGGNIDLAGNIDVDGTLEADAITVNGTALNTVIAGVTVTNATNAAHVLITDNESTSEENQITFVENATGGTANRGLEADGNLTYNPSTGTVTATVFKASGEVEGGSLDINGNADISGDLVVTGQITNAGNVLVSQGSPKLILKDSTDNDDHSIIFRNNSDGDDYKIATADFTSGGGGDGFYMGSINASEFGLVTNNTTALTLDSSQNATFAGNVSASGYIAAEGNISSSTTVFTKYLRLPQTGAGSQGDGSIHFGSLTGDNAYIYDDTSNLVIGYNDTDGIQINESGISGGVKGTLFGTAAKFGRDAHNLIDFTTDNAITFRVNNANEITLNANNFGPTTSDGIALGTSSKMWSDLFLASGAVINFNNGDITLTHTSNHLTFAGGTLVVPILNIGANPHQIADGAEFADSSDNTIMEFADDAVTFSAGSTTINGKATIAKRRFNISSTTNNNLSQGDVTYIGGEGSIAAGDIVYLDTSGNWQKARANASATSIGLLGIALGSNAGNNGILLRGMFTLDHDVGDNQGIPLYLSEDTAGQAKTAAPNSSGDFVRVIGYNVGDADEIWFSPDNTFVEVA